MKSKPDLHFFVEPLESRLMLSGNVLAALLGGDLWIQGDEFDNNFSLEVVDNQVVLLSNGETTINGTADPFVVSEGDSVDGRLFVHLGRGNDQFVAGPGIEFDAAVRVVGGAGDDTIGLEGVKVTDKLRITSGSGNDAIALLDVDAARVVVATGTGDDLVNVDGASVDRHMRISTNAGDDDVVVESSSVGGGVIVSTGSGADDLAVEDSAVQGKLIAVAGSGDDVVRVDDSTVEGVSLLFLNSGDDTVALIGDSEFVGPLRVLGGLGSDASATASTVSADDINGFSFESDGIAAELIESRLDSEATGAIGIATAIQSELFDLGPSEPLILSLDTSSANNLVASNGISIVEDPSFTIEGQTSAGSLIEIDQNGDGLFNDGTTTADENGNFSITTTLTNDQTNLGLNVIQVRATDGNGAQVTDSTSVHVAQGTVVRYSTSLGEFDIELLDEAAPVTVENFLSYLDDFENSIVHRSPGTGFVIQGGGFTAENGIVESVPTDSAIDSEFDTENSNLRGTISTALLGGDPNSATSGWFINTDDNSFLDASGHTVFGRIIGDGLSVVDAIDQLPSLDVSALVGPAFGEVPLRSYTPFSQQLTGTLALDANGDLVTGTGTQFSSELVVGQTILLNSTQVVAREVVSDTELVIEELPAQTESIADTIGQVNTTPTDENYVFVDINPL